MTWDEMIEALDEAIERIRSAPRPFSGELEEDLESVEACIQEAGLAWGGGWAGYQANVYKKGFEPKEPTDHFDTESGGEPMAQMMSRTSGEWVHYDPSDTYKSLFLAADADEGEMRDAAEELRQVFERVQFDVRIVFDLLCEDGHERLCEIGREVEEMKPFISLSMLRLATVQEHTGGQVQTRDRRALQGGIHMPAHLAARCALQHYVSHEDKLGELGKKLLRAKNLIEHMNQPTSQKTHGNKVFIGHGGADAWKDLRFFLGGKLGLDVDEFNMEPAAGLTTKERLEEMLEAAGIAFLVLTAEDEHEDGTVHARENVIHEAGLFQGRLGFRRAIILLEEGCEEFSNIAGITQIRFPEGNIMAKSEEIRGVLEREGFIE